MRYVLYKASEWIEPKGVPFIYSHAFNRSLSHVHHCHDFYEIIYLFSGNARHCINGKFYDMTECDVAFLRPMEAHNFYEQSAGLELYSISVTVEEMNVFLKAYHLYDSITARKEPVLFSISRTARHNLLSSFRQLDTASNTLREAQIRIILGSTLHEYLSLLASESSEWIDRILMQMRLPQNLQKGIPAFLKISSLSHAQLCRVVKKRTGKTPQQYIKDIRMTYAYELILSTDLSYEEISLMIGYSSLSHFATSFKKHFGLSPASLRKHSTLL